MFCLKSVIQRIEQNVEGDLFGVVAAVARALEGVVLLQRAGDVVGGEDHRPPILDPDPLELGRALHLAGRERAVAPGRLVERDLADVEAAVLGGREDRVVGRDLLQGAARQDLGDLAAKGGRERRRGADGVGQERAAAIEEGGDGLLLGEWPPRRAWLKRGAPIWYLIPTVNPADGSGLPRLPSGQSWVPERDVPGGMRREVV